MKKNIKLPVVVAMATALTLPSMAATKFPDVMSDAWYKGAVENAVSNGLLSGYEDGTMRPENYVTRAEVAAIFGKAFGAEEKASLKKFDDMESNKWYYDAVAKAVNMGLFVGDSNDCINPENYITREEIAVVVTKAFDLAVPEKSELSKFNDAKNASEWAVPYLSALVDNGYMSGDNLGNLNPKKNITRAELAQIMSNITNNYIVNKGTVSDEYEGTVVVRVPGVTLKDSTVTGDVVVADGVGTGEFTLDNVEIDGNLVVRGGGVNSIKILNKSKISGKIVLRNPNGKTRIHSDKTIDADIEINSPVVIDATCENVIVNDSVEVEVKGKVDTIEVNAEKAEITGKGDVKIVNANADDVKVSVKDAKVTAAEGVTGVTAGSKEVKPGKTETVKTEGTAGGGGGNTSSTTVKSLSFEIKDGTYYSITGNGDFANKFDRTVYDVTVSGVVEKTGRITSGVDAFTFVTEILGSLTEEQVEKVMLTLDHKKEVDGEGFFTKANYDEYRGLLKAAGLLMGDSHPNYDKLLEVEEKYYNADGGIEKASFEAFYADFKTETTSLEGLMGEITSMGDEVTTLLGNLYGESFITNLLK